MSIGQNKKGKDKKEEINVKDLRLYDFLNYLSNQKDPNIKDSLLNVYFNSEEYTKKRFNQQLEDRVEMIRLQFIIDTLSSNNNTKEVDLKAYKDSLNEINSRFISIKDKFISKNDRALQTKTFVGVDYGYSALGPLAQISMMKNLSQVKVSYWGLSVGIQQNDEATPPIVVGIKNLTKFTNSLFVYSFSVWVSGIRENKLAGHVKSRVGRILRGNTYGAHYGFGMLVGKPNKRNKIISLGVNAQKYIEIDEEYVANPNGMGIAYSTEFTLGGFLSLTFIL